MRSEFPQVERRDPVGRIGPRRVYTLPLDQVRPIVHLAHAWDGLPNIRDKRIIFDHEFVLTTGGGGVIETDGGTATFRPYELLFFPPFVRHAITPQGSAKGEHLAVHFDWSPEVPGRRDPKARRPYEVHLAGDLQVPARVPLAPGHRVEKEFRALVRAWTSGQPLGKFEAATALSNMIAWVLRHAADAAHRSPSDLRNRARVERAIAFARERLTGPLSADELAEVAGVSRSRLTSLFRRATGYAPLEYIRSLRVDEAKRLLADVELPVKEIAARTGFADAYHFSHAFHRVVGLTATQYRAMLLGGRNPSA